MKDASTNSPEQKSRAAAHEKSAVSSAVSLSAPIQMYTKPGGKKLSATGNFYVKNGDKTKLFVKAGAAVGSRGGQIIADGSNENYLGSAYTGYHYYVDEAGGFVNDCLGLAEKLALSDPSDTGRAEFRAPGNGKVFGHSYSQNTEIAQDNAWFDDEATDPAIGEAYAIAPTVKPGENPDGYDEAPYHVAAVIAKDGTDNITLEADAGSALTRPIFDMYDSQPPGTRVNANSKTFHEVYSPNFTYTREETGGGKKRKKVRTNYAPSTGLLRPRTD